MNHQTSTEAADGALSSGCTRTTEAENTRSAPTVSHPYHSESND